MRHHHPSKNGLLIEVARGSVRDGVIISRTGRRGSAPCTAAGALSWTLSVWPGLESSRYRRQWTANRGLVWAAALPFRRPPWRAYATASSTHAPRPRPTSRAPPCSGGGERLGGPVCPSSSPRPPSGKPSCRRSCCGGRSWAHRKEEVSSEVQRAFTCAMGKNPVRMIRFSESSE